MLSAADFAGFDLSGLSSGLQSMVVRQDRYRREAASIGVRPDCPETYRLVQAAERDAAVLADAERLVALVRQFAADESTRPAAPVLRLVRKDDVAPAPDQPTARSLVRRALAAISGARSGETSNCPALSPESHHLTTLAARAGEDGGRDA
ncbi:hypothetical protein HNR00_003534 [Methylorubrum rhodinum]|uniref:Uncharacterized protein n=1 Tax=Methylorubrum rhodinum TaxID=29428 RepID=A0A840ZPK3_9HYPH|nr:hypothetical protein [Methylorubrum rhodinum]MBB5758807.1 hypothetical protein [Methylorubrum rhodinum]